MNILRIWDRFGDLFGQTPLHPQYFIYKAEEKALKITLKEIEGRVIDIGCGQQKLKGIIERKGLSYTSLDHPSVYKRQRSKTKPDVLADITSIPLKNNSFGSVLLFMTLEHLPNPEKGLDEIKRILTKKGKVFILTIENYPEHDSPNDYFRYKLSGVNSVCKNVGLKIAKSYAWGNIWQVIAVNFNVFIFQTIKLLFNKTKSFLLLIILLIFLYPLTIFINLLAIILSPLDIIKSSKLVCFVIAQK